MHYHPTTVSSLVVRGLINQLGMKDVEELVHKQFPEIDRHTLWESYNIALVVRDAALRGTSKSSVPGAPTATICNRLPEVSQALCRSRMLSPASRRNKCWRVPVG
jgi:hypothetical protein